MMVNKPGLYGGGGSLSFPAESCAKPILMKLLYALCHGENVRRNWIKSRCRWVEMKKRLSTSIRSG